MNYSLRQGDVSDAAKIAACHVASWQVGYRGFVADSYLDSLTVEKRTADWQEWLQAEGLHMQLAVDSQQNVAGFLSFGPVRTRFPGDKGVIASVPGEVYACYVHPDHWRKGVGRSLFATVPALCKAKRYGAFGLWVLEGNKTGIQFYTNLGGARSGKMDVDVGAQQLKELAFVWRDFKKLQTG